MKKSKKLDPSSENYRKCPECEKEFMTDHLNRDFCNRKCADTFHNRKKRLSKSPPEAPAITIPAEPQKTERQLKVEDNIKKLELLNVKAGQAIVLKKSKLDEINFDISQYTNKHSYFEGKDDKKVRYELNFGHYSLININEKEVKLFNRKTT